MDPHNQQRTAKRPVTNPAVLLAAYSAGPAKGWARSAKDQQSLGILGKERASLLWFEKATIIYWRLDNYSLSP